MEIITYGGVTVVVVARNDEHIARRVSRGTLPAAVPATWRPQLLLQMAAAARPERPKAATVMGPFILSRVLARELRTVEL